MTLSKFNDKTTKQAARDMQQCSSDHRYIKNDDCRPCLRCSRPSKLPTITLFVNADRKLKFKKMLVNKHHLTTWNSFLQASAKVIGEPGPVRDIVTPVRGTRLTNVQQLKDGATYVAILKGRFKQTRNNTVHCECREQNEQANCYESSTLEPTPEKTIKRAELIQVSTTKASGRTSLSPIRATTILVFANGNEFEVHRIPISHDLLDSYEDVLKLVAQKVKDVHGDPRLLYTVDGQKVTDPCRQLVNGGMYVAVGLEVGGFIRRDYGCMQYPCRSNQRCRLPFVRRKLSELKFESIFISPPKDCSKRPNCDAVSTYPSSDDAGNDCVKLGDVRCQRDLRRLHMEDTLYGACCCNDCSNSSQPFEQQQPPNVDVTTKGDMAASSGCGHRAARLRRQNDDTSAGYGRNDVIMDGQPSCSYQNNNRQDIGGWCPRPDPVRTYRSAGARSSYLNNDQSSMLTCSRHHDGNPSPFHRFNYLWPPITEPTVASTTARSCLDRAASYPCPADGGNSCVDLANLTVLPAHSRRRPSSCIAKSVNYDNGDDNNFIVDRPSCYPSPLDRDTISCNNLADLTFSVRKPDHCDEATQTEPTTIASDTSSFDRPTTYPSANSVDTAIQVSEDKIVRAPLIQTETKETTSRLSKVDGRTQERSSGDVESSVRLNDDGSGLNDVIKYDDDDHHNVNSTRSRNLDSLSNTSDEQKQKTSNDDTK